MKFWKIVLLAIFFILVFQWFGTVGVHYDEVFWVNAAKGGLTNDFVLKRVFGIPVMLMPYIGALKPFLYFLIFKIFGVSMLTIRAPTFFLWILGIIIFIRYWPYNKIKDDSKYNLIALMMVFNPTIMFLSITDFGPVVIDFVLRILIYKLVFFRIDQKNKINYLISLFLVLGIFNKLNFVWFLNSLLALFLFRLLFAEKKCYLTKLVEILKIFLLPYFVFFCIFFIFNSRHDLDSVNFFSHFILIFNGLFQMIFGVKIYEYLGLSTFFIPVFYVFIVILFVFSLISICIAVQKHKLDETAANSILFAMIFVQILLTNKAGASWHLYMLFPYVYFLLFEMAERLLSRMVLYIFLFILFILNERILFLLHKDEIPNRYWSRYNYDLINYVTGSDEKFISVDWGINNQIMAFSKKDQILLDYWSFFCSSGLDKATINWLDNNFLSNTSYNYIRLTSGEGQVLCGKKFDDLILSLGYHFEKKSTIPTNKPLFIIGKLVKN